MMLKKFDAIIFDLGGVILNLDYDRTITAFKKLGKENFDKLYTQSYQEGIFDLFETGEISSDDFLNYMLQFMPSDVQAFQIVEAWNAMLGDLPTERVELLKSLKKKYNLFLLSNTNDLHLTAFKSIINQQHGNPDLLETLFDKTYYSHLIGLRKPNANVFEHVLNSNNLSAQKTLFIDDTERHILGAQRLGIQTIHLQNQNISDLNLLSLY